MTEPPLVRCSVTDGLARLVLDRPEKLNALLPATLIQLGSHLERLAARDDIGCLVLSGRGAAFCAGLDLEAVADRRFAADARLGARTLDMLEAFPYPTVAGIRGHCVTGGLELALACDLLVCAEDARFGDTHARWGLVPTWGLTVRLPERVGHARAKELSFTGRIIDGRTAADIGLVDRCVPTDELEAAMASLTGQILANSRESTRISKALYRHRGTTERKAALEFERALPFGLPRDMAERLSW